MFPLVFMFNARKNGTEEEMRKGIHLLVCLDRLEDQPTLSSRVPLPAALGRRYLPVLSCYVDPAFPAEKPHVPDRSR